MIAAQGAIPVENPMVLPIGEPAVSVTHYGYDSDGPLLPSPGDVQPATHQVEATKTEPDKNTYLVLRHQTGADPAYDYGSHFLFQGHENGARGAGTITRINLDADAADGDNEITGIHISNGDPTARGLLGAEVPRPFHAGFRVFFTQQHGDNPTWEILARDRDRD